MQQGLSPQPRVLRETVAFPHQHRVVVPGKPEGARVYSTMQVARRHHGTVVQQSVGRACVALVQVSFRVAYPQLVGSAEQR